MVLAVHLYRERRDLLPPLVRLGSQVPTHTVNVANMLKKHLHSLLTYFPAPYYQRLQRSLQQRDTVKKYAASGFRSSNNYSIKILFFCGRLDVKPSATCDLFKRETHTDHRSHDNP